MLVSKKMLNDINPLFSKMSDKTFIQLCNQVGIEVEQVLKHPITNGLQICLIKEIKKHPNADKLNLVTIEIANKKNIEVVCGANNLELNKYAIFAPVGTTLYNGITLTEKNIRGVKSCGMLCAYSELTNIGSEFISDDEANGIIILDNAVIGDTNIDKYININDTIYELSLPSNRNDLNGLAFIANELCFAMKYNSIIKWDFDRIFSWPTSKPNIDLKICNNIGFILVKNIPNIKPNWKQKEMLMAAGYKIHNNVLDLLNMFSINYANPIHVYNAEHLSLNELSVKRVEQQQKLLCLDGNEYKVEKGTIGIFKGNNELINIAGIIGSNKYKYVNGCKDIIIEIGNFDHNIIRRTCEKMGISSKAGTIFSKELSAWITQNTFYEICKFFRSINLDIEYAYNFESLSRKVIKFNRSKLYEFIGIDESLTFNDLFENDLFLVPPSRIDILNEYDVFEELTKIIDVNNLKIKPIEFSINENFDLTKYNKIKTIKNYLQDLSLFETKTYNLSSEDKFDLINLFDIKSKIKILNPISKNREYLRVSLFDEMLKVMQYNISRKRILYNIYEIQNIQKNEHDSFLNLSMLFTQPIIHNKIAKNEIDLSILNIKTLISNMFKKIGIEIKFKLIEKEIKEVYKDVIAIIANNISIGYIALINNSLLKQYDLTNAYAVAIDLTNAFKLNQKIEFSPISQFPTVKRDINIKTSYELINDVIESIKKHKNIIDCFIKDVYENEQFTTFTLALTISDLSKTLSTNEINKIIDEILINEQVIK